MTTFAEAQNLLYSAPEGRSPDDKYPVLRRPASMAPVQAAIARAVNGR